MYLSILFSFLFFSCPFEKNNNSLSVCLCVCVCVCVSVCAGMKENSVQCDVTCYGGGGAVRGEGSIDSSC